MITAEASLVQQLRHARAAHQALVPVLRTRFPRGGAAEHLWLIKILREALGFSLADASRLAGHAFDATSDQELESRLQAALGG